MHVVHHRHMSMRRGEGSITPQAHTHTHSLPAGGSLWQELPLLATAGTGALRALLQAVTGQGGHRVGTWCALGI